MIILPEENIFYEPLDFAAEKKKDTEHADVFDRERQKNARGNKTEKCLS